MAAAVRQSHSRVLDAVLFAMWRSNCRRAWALRARAAERRRLAEAAVWARAARRALRALNAATFEPSEAVAALRALGGEWRGGRRVPRERPQDVGVWDQASYSAAPPRRRASTGALLAPLLAAAAAAAALVVGGAAIEGRREHHSR